MSVHIGNDVVVRAGTAADLPEITAMERQCYADPWPASAFAALPDNPRVFFLVALEPATGRLVGYAISWYVLYEGELANLAVMPSARRRGIGRVLLKAMLDDAIARQVSELFLEVRESNVAARELYAAQGFVEIGRRKEYYRRPKEDALILRRQLGSAIT